MHKYSGRHPIQIRPQSEIRDKKKKHPVKVAAGTPVEGDTFTNNFSHYWLSSSFVHFKDAIFFFHSNVEFLSGQVDQLSEFGPSQVTRRPVS